MALADRECRDSYGVDGSVGGVGLAPRSRLLPIAPAFTGVVLVSGATSNVPPIEVVRSVEYRRRWHRISSDANLTDVELWLAVAALPVLGFVLALPASGGRSIPAAAAVGIASGGVLLGLLTQRWRLSGLYVAFGGVRVKRILYTRTFAWDQVQRFTYSAAPKGLSLIPDEG